MSTTPGGGLNEDTNFCLDVQEADATKSKLIAPHMQAKNLISSAEVDNGNSAAADTVDWTAGMYQKSTLTGNCTFTFTAPQGPTQLRLKLVQDGTGSRLVTWPSAVKWAGGTAPTLSTGAAAVDIIDLYFDGTNYYGRSILNVS